MSSEFCDLITLIGFLFFSFYLVIIFLRIKNGWKLKGKLNEYNRLLEMSVKTRYDYIRVIEKARLLLRNIDTMKRELAERKARLTKLRAELREKLKEIRSELWEGKKSISEERYIELLKMELKQHWQVFNSLKKIYKETLSQYQAEKEQHKILAEEEQCAYQKWMRDKELVLSHFKKISKQIPIRHPFKLFEEKRKTLSQP